MIRNEPDLPKSDQTRQAGWLLFPLLKRLILNSCSLCALTGRAHPTLCKSLRSQRIKHIVCGEDHTVALTAVSNIYYTYISE